MNKAIVGIFVATAVVIGGLIWIGQPAAQKDSQNDSSPSLLESNETLFDFGTISMAKGKVNHEFTISNTSDQPVTIRKVFSSCMCTAAAFKLNGKTYGPFGMEGMGGVTSTNITMNPGDAGSIEAVYDPNAHGPAGVGSIDRFVYVEDSNGGQVQFEIKAIVTP